MDSSILTFKNILNSHDNIVFFGGAGVSTESGIPDFRGNGGLSSRDDMYSFEELLSHEFLFERTELFFDFYKKNMVFPNARPNGAHKALAELEKLGKLSAVITQNIDSLHQLAGSKNVFELHGSVHRYFCTNCKKKFGLDHIMKDDKVPTCDECGSLVRPDVVLYGEALPSFAINGAIEAISSCDVLIVGGTSLVVYPAAGLLQYFNGDKLVLINKSETPYDRYADYIFRDNIGYLMEKAVFDR